MTTPLFAKGLNLTCQPIFLDEQNVASVLPDGAIAIWNAATGIQLSSHPTGLVKVESLDSPRCLQGRFAACDREFLRVFNKTCEGKPPTIRPYCSSVRYSPSGKYIAVFTKGRESFEIHDGETLALIASTKYNTVKKAIFDLTFLDDESVLVLSGGKDPKWDELIYSKAILSAFTFLNGEVKRITKSNVELKARGAGYLSAIGNGEKVLVVVGSQVWISDSHATSQRSIRKLGEVDHGVAGVSLSPSGKFFAEISSPFRDDGPESSDEVLQIIEVDSFREVHRRHHSFCGCGMAVNLAWSPDESMVVGTGVHGLYVWQLDNGCEPLHLNGPPPPETCRVTSPDNRLSLTAENNGRLCAWPESGNDSLWAQILPEVAYRHVSIVFDSSGKFVATLADFFIRVLSSTDGSTLGTYNGHGICADTVPGSEGHLIFWDGNSVYRWISAHNIQAIFAWQDITNAAGKVLDQPHWGKISGNGRRGAVRCKTGSVLLFDVGNPTITPCEISSFVLDGAVQSAIRSYEFSPCGNLLLTENDGGVKEVWNTQTGQPEL